jgi:hypothetical protein
VNEVVDEYKREFGEDLEAMMLYGSAVSGDYRPGKSDINFMIVLSDRGIQDLERALPVVDRWRKRNVATPLFLTREYVKSSLDVFPIEYLNFQHNHVLAYGEDLLQDLELDREHLRLQCEREVKGKLLLLREAFFEGSGKGKALRQVVDQSIPAFSAIFEALLYLEGKEMPRGKREIIRSACEVLNLDHSVFERLLDVKEEITKPGSGEMRGLYQAYLSEVRKLANRVDRMGG